MKKISTVLIFIISGTILNVWLFRLHKPTSFRGNDASTLMEEFLVYGLDKNLFYIVGIVKVITSILLLFGIIKKKASNSNCKHNSINNGGCIVDAF